MGLSPQDLRPYRGEALKVPVALVRSLARGPRRGKIVLVTAMTPTKHGEGKTVTSIGVTMALRRAGHRAVVCLRQPSLGPVFGVKGGAAGGGRATVEPADTINLGLTGDLDAVAAAHNLIAAVFENHLFHGNPLGIDGSIRLWPRTLDVEDRALRQIVTNAQGGAKTPPQPGSFVIAAASEIMAVVGLAKDYDDLKERVGRILLGFRTTGDPVRVRDLKATGSACALLRFALEPNLLQAKDGTPALIHGGPFANIAHGTCSRLSIELAQATADYCVVEAGFATELGAEKFVDIVGPLTGLGVDGAVLVATLRGLRYHGGVPDDQLGSANPEAVLRGLANLEQHVQNLRTLGIEPVVAANRFPGDTEEELGLLKRFCDERDLALAESTAYADGAPGAESLAARVVEICARGGRSQPLYPPGTPIEEALDRIVRRLYGGAGVALSAPARETLESLHRIDETDGPVCVAKTPLSLSDNPVVRGRPTGFLPTVQRFTRSAGAGFTVAYLGEIQTMPGLPRRPLAEQIDLTSDGRVVGLV
ncbi:MAG: formate--tetrahydrofolate ligase [Thermoplasmata archaeon]|nr:formate--tetrahydrofolate ligase [Thermoplasmata archaeon]